MAGPWEKYAAQGGQPVQISPADPKIPGAMDATAASTANTRQQMSQRAALSPYQLREAAAKAAIAEANLKKMQAGSTLTSDKLKSVRQDAVNKIQLARKLKGRSRNEWFATGFGAPTMAGFGGTAARGVQAGADTLKAGGALAEVLKLTAANGGKNPFQPMSNSDVELIARNTANLDIGQPDKDFQSAVQQYEDAYRRAFIGAGGDINALNARLSGKRTKSKPKNNGVEFLGFEDD